MEMARKRRKKHPLPDGFQIKAKHLKIKLEAEKVKNESIREKMASLQSKLLAFEEEKTHQECSAKVQINNLKLELYSEKLSRSKAQAALLNQTVNRVPPITIIERPVNNCCEAEALQGLLEEVQSLKRENSILKSQVQVLPQSFCSVVSDTVLKVQDAIRENAIEYSQLLVRYRKEVQKRKTLHNALVKLRGNIRVYVRPKPLVNLDSAERVESVFSFDPEDDTVIKVISKSREFQMEKVFTQNASQVEVFNEVSALIQSVLDGQNVCIFAYGQTGSGKTHTMEGSLEDPGVNQRALKLLYEEARESATASYQLECCMIEIYNETIRDLLSPDSEDRLEVKMKPEGGLHVPGLVWMPVCSIDEINRISRIAQENRVTASTAMNEQSSRSHFILCITVEETNLLTGAKTKGRLNLVDLAGSERVSKSQVEGARLKEAQNINKSLLCLGDVVNALKNNHGHVPFRNSKLTYLLQESLGGDSKTLMILQVSSHPDNLSETLSTLVFGQRVRSVELNGRNTPLSVRRLQSDTPTPTHSARKLVDTVVSSGGASGRTPLSSLAKASSVPCRLNTKTK